jgi:elongation factor P
MKIGPNSIRAGHILEYKGKLYVVSKTPEHTMPGKGGAFVQVEMKDIKTGTKINERFRSAETVEKIRVDVSEYQFLYLDENFINLMNLEDYEQTQIEKSYLGDKAAYLTEGMVVKVDSYDNTIVSITLPSSVIGVVAETEPVVKGQTAASSYKPAVLENGVRVMVPPFINQGDRIVVNTEDNTYIERDK